MARDRLTPKKVQDRNGKETTVYVRRDLERASDRKSSGTTDSVRKEIMYEDEMITSTDDYYNRAQDAISSVLEKNSSALRDIADNGADSRFLGTGDNHQRASRALDLATSESIADSFSDHLYDSTEYVPVRYLSSGREQEYNEELAAHLYSDESFDEFYGELSDDEKNPLISIQEHISDQQSGQVVSSAAFDNQFDVIKRDLPDLHSKMVAGDHDSVDHAVDALPRREAEMVMTAIEDNHRDTIRKSYERFVKNVTGISHY